MPEAVGGVEWPRRSLTATQVGVLGNQQGARQLHRRAEHPGQVASPHHGVERVVEADDHADSVVAPYRYISPAAAMATAAALRAAPRRVGWHLGDAIPIESPPVGG